MRRLFYILAFLVALIVIDAGANHSRYTKPVVDGAFHYGQRFTNTVRLMVDDLLRWASQSR